MKSYPEIEQGSPEWFQLRMGKVTASELHNLVTPEFELRKGEMPYTFLCTKLAESWRGKPLPGFTSFDTEQGSILQDEALPWYQFTFDKKVSYCGFIENDEGTAGCSPDGLIGEDKGIEIKCPASHTHVKYLMNGASVPKEYLAQVHGSMFVTGFPRWTFLSYRRGFPQLLVEVQRNEAIIAKIGEAIAKFHVDFKAGIEKMEAMKT